MTVGTALSRSEVGGLRERRKDERRRRIIAAARAVFRERGFDDATTAEIAKRAAVGTGTLFRYATDKHELLLMVLNDELAAITDASIAGIDRRRSLLTQLVEFYRPRFEFWGADLALARAATVQVYASRPPGDGVSSRRSAISFKVMRQ
jgi:AcrR family transcriptional regulator